LKIGGLKRNQLNMMNETEVIASTLVNFSTLGFLIIIGTAAFVPMVYDLSVHKKNKSVGIARFYPVRLISRLAQTSSVRFLMIISFLFILTGLLGLFFFYFENDFILTCALLLSIITISILLIFILYISIDAISIKKEELDEIVEYSTNEFYM